MRWKRHGVRNYTRKSVHTQAFVFGSSRPQSLWAWAVYWMGGRAIGVETGMLHAKKKAEEWQQASDKEMGAAS